MDARVWQFGLVRRAWAHRPGHCPACTRVSDHGRARHCLRSFDRGDGVRTGFYRGGVDRVRNLSAHRATRCTAAGRQGRVCPSVTPVRTLRRLDGSGLKMVARPARNHIVSSRTDSNAFWPVYSGSGMWRCPVGIRLRHCGLSRL